MATSGTNSFSLKNYEVIEEAFERIQVGLDSITAQHLRSAKRSLDLLYIDWENRIPKQYKIEENSITTTANTLTYSLPTDTLEVISMVYNDGDVDTPIYEIGRDEYLRIPYKTDYADKPDRFFFDKQESTRIITLWPGTSTAGHTIKSFLWVQTEDAGAYADNPDVARWYLDALCAGMAWKLAEKYNPGLYEQKGLQAEAALKRAENRNSENTDIIFTYDMRR